MLVAATTAHAADRLHLVVAGQAGGPADLLARLLARSLESAGQPSLVENRPGASGTLAAQRVASARPGEPLILVAGIGATVTAPHLFPNLPYRPALDLRALALLATSGMALVVPADGAPDSVPHLLRPSPRTGARPLLFGSSGVGTANHLCAQALALETGRPLQAVPFQGDVQALASVAGGDLDFMFMAPNVALPLARTGQARVLAVTGATRSTALPGVPTMAEAGVAGFQCLAWTMAFVPAHTPAAQVAAWSRAWQQALDDPAVRQRIGVAGLDVPGLADAAAAQQLFVAEQARVGRLMRPPQAAHLQR